MGFLGRGGVEEGRGSLREGAWLDVAVVKLGGGKPTTDIVVLITVSQNDTRITQQGQSLFPFLQKSSSQRSPLLSLPPSLSPSHPCGLAHLPGAHSCRWFFSDRTVKALLQRAGWRPCGRLRRNPGGRASFSSAPTPSESCSGAPGRSGPRWAWPVRRSSWACRRATGRRRRAPAAPQA